MKTQTYVQARNKMTQREEQYTLTNTQLFVELLLIAWQSENPETNNDSKRVNY